jgi:peptide chain release factor 3
VIQSFELLNDYQTAPLLGAVGQLQFEVVAYRLEAEYGADPRMEPAPFAQIRWFSPSVTRATLDSFYLGTGVKVATDIRGQFVILFPDKWGVEYFIKEHPGVELHTVSPHATA